jgi:hypothetical protein
MIESLLLAVATFASTPEQAALDVFGSHRASVQIVRSRVVGNFALVQTQGGKLEGAFVTNPTLLQHFTFGWQAISGDRCALTRVPKADAEALTRGFSFAPADRVCPAPDDRDVGSPDDIAAVRKLMRGPFVPYVRISGSYALGEWYGAGGGQWIYRKRNGRWMFLTGGGGAMNAEELQKYGIPAADAHVLLSGAQ